jgi:arginine decarboxylase
MWFDTKSIILSAGHSTGGSELNAFDNAMRRARIADFNIIRVTSIVPPGCPVRVMDSSGPVLQGKGHMLPAVYSTLCSSVPGDVISAAVAVGIPLKNDQNAGVIFTREGHCDEASNIASLRSMIDEGMHEMRLVPEYEFRYASASTTVVEGFTSVFAAASFCDEHLLRIFET